MASVPALGAGGRGFESHLPDHYICINADVAELADALALGASGFTVGVRIPSSAPNLERP